MAHLPQLDVNDAARRSLARRKLELRHLARLSRFAPQRRARRAGSRPPRVAPAAHRACVCPGDDRLGFLPRADARAEHAHCPPDVHAPTRSRPLAPLAILVRRDPSGTRDRGGTLRLVRAAGLRAGLGMVCGGGCVAVLSGNTRRTWRGDPVCVFPVLVWVHIRVNPLSSVAQPNRVQIGGITMPFRGVDYFCVDSLFNQDELMVRSTARRFAEERILPLIRDCYRDARFPTELIPEMAQLGFLGANLHGYGCAGMSNVEYGLVMQELERIDSGIRSFVSVQGALVMYPIHSMGSEEQKQKWLPLLQSGKAVGCSGLTDPDSGSTPAGMRTTAVRDGDTWVLNGEKTWITNGTMADVAVVWARAAEGIVGFLVERATKGYSTSDIHGKWSMRASVTSSLAFSDCRVKESDRLPGAKGLKAPLSCLSQARYWIGWGVLGAAMDCYETARSYSVTRKQFDDRPIASHH